LHIIIAATVLPIDKIIGKIYPVLGLLLLLSAIVWDVYVDNPIPELTLTNMHPKDLPYYPVIFLTISAVLYLDMQPNHQ
jgi:carbon starvation protein CstA